MHLSQLESQLLQQALGYPEAAEDYPWGERVIKVRGKIFLFLGIVPEGLRVGVKLPFSSQMAAHLPGCTPSGYGLGKHGWITAIRKPDGSGADSDSFPDWILESYRAVAPKRLVALLDQAG